MQIPEKLKINISVGTEKIVLNIDKNQEQFYRKAATDLKKRLKYIEDYSRPANEDIRMGWLALDFALEREQVLQAAVMKKIVKNELVERNARVFVVETRNYYEEKSPGSNASQILKYTAYHCAVELEKLKCTCCYCRKRSLNSDSLKENPCPKHPEGPLAGKHRSIYELYKNKI